MSSRNTYTALTPDCIDSAHPHSAEESSDFTVDPDVEDSNDGAKQDRSYAVLETIKNNAGLLLVVASQAFLSFVNVAVKKLNNIDPPVSTLELIAVRMGITYACSLTYMVSTGVPDPFLGPKGVRLLLVFRGFSGFVALFGMYYSLKFLSLSDATVITFLAPLCTGIAGALFLKENFTTKEALASFFSLCGVVLIARPVFLFGDTSNIPDPVDTGTIRLPDNLEKGTPTERLVAVGVALLGVLGATGVYTSLRAIGKRAHPLHALTSFSFQSVIVSVIGMIATKTPFIVPKRLDWVALLIMIGIFGFTAQIFLTMGLQRETAGRGSLGVYTQVVFATILQRIFFKSTPSALSVIGTLVIITSALYIALTKEQPNKAKLDIIRLNAVQEEDLEEGLLQREEQSKDSTSPRWTSHENSQPSPKSQSHTNLDVTIEAAHIVSDPNDNTKILSY